MHKLRHSLILYSLLAVINMNCAVAASSADAVMNQPANVQRLSINPAYPEGLDIIDSVDQCVHAALYSLNGSNSYSTKIENIFTFTNDCSDDVNLLDYRISFVSKELNNNFVMLNSAGWPGKIGVGPDSNPISGIKFEFDHQNTDLTNPRLIGKFENYIATDNNNLIIRHGETVFFDSVTDFNYPFIYAKVKSVGIVGGQPNYAKNTLTDIPLGSFGLKTLMILNNSAEGIYSIQFPKLPKEITYDTSRSSCNIYGRQELYAGDSCSIVLKYIPLVEGEDSILSLNAVGFRNQQLVTAPSIGVEYTSRFTGKPYPGINVGPGTKIGGITLNTIDNPSYIRDSLESITVSYVGLKSYVIKNVSSVKLYAITLPTLSGNFAYDGHTTCHLDNKLILSPNQSCMMVIKYTPKTKGEKGILPIQVAGLDPDSFIVYANSLLSVPYSSNH